MSKHRFDRVPVVDDDGTVVGIVTRHDIMKILGL
jgi:CBS domain-containing protein